MDILLPNALLLAHPPDQVELWDYYRRPINRIILHCP